MSDPQQFLFAIPVGPRARFADMAAASRLNRERWLTV